MSITRKLWSWTGPSEMSQIKAKELGTVIPHPPVTGGRTMGTWPKKKPDLRYSGSRGGKKHLVRILAPTLAFFQSLHSDKPFSFHRPLYLLFLPRPLPALSKLSSLCCSLKAPCSSFHTLVFINNSPFAC